MMVYELIEELEKANPFAEVVVSQFDKVGCMDHVELQWVYEYSPVVELTGGY